MYNTHNNIYIYIYIYIYIMTGTSNNVACSTVNYRYILR